MRLNIMRKIHPSAVSTHQFPIAQSTVCVYIERFRSVNIGNKESPPHRPWSVHPNSHKVQCAEAGLTYAPKRRTLDITKQFGKTKHEIRLYTILARGLSVIVRIEHWKRVTQIGTSW